MEYMFLSIINSNHSWYAAHTNYPDGLNERDWLIWYLDKWGFPQEILQEAYNFDKMAGLRTFITSAADRLISGESLSEDHIRGFKHYLSLYTHVYGLKEDEGKFELTINPVKANWDYVMSEIAASFIKAIPEFSENKFRRCENPDCRSMYHDSSKNQKRRWCCNACSSLIKVRRFRSRQNL